MTCGSSSNGLSPVIKTSNAASSSSRSASPIRSAWLRRARRLTIRSSQVGAVAPARRGRRSHADRMALALRLLEDPAFDALITGESPFDELPQVLPRLAGGELPALCHRIRYPGIIQPGG